MKPSGQEQGHGGVQHPADAQPGQGGQVNPDPDSLPDDHCR